MVCHKKIKNLTSLSLYASKRLVSLFRLSVDKDGLARSMQENLFGQHIAQHEVILALGNFFLKTICKFSKFNYRVVKMPKKRTKVQS